MITKSVSTSGVRSSAGMSGILGGFITTILFCCPDIMVGKDHTSSDTSSFWLNQLIAFMINIVWLDDKPLLTDSYYCGSCSPGVIEKLPYLVSRHFPVQSLGWLRIRTLLPASLQPCAESRLPIVVRIPVMPFLAVSLMQLPLTFISSASPLPVSNSGMRPEPQPTDTAWFLLRHSMTPDILT